MDDALSTPYQLSTLSPNVCRPTIPYSQSRFPRTTLHDWRDRDEEAYSTEASSDFLSDDGEMENTHSSEMPRSGKEVGASDVPRSGLSSQGGNTMENGQLIRDDGQEDNVHFDLDDASEDEHDDEETGLTATDRQRRAPRRSRGTTIDPMRGVGGANANITAQEKREADQHVIRRMIINVLLIGLWYLFSLSISIYNKWMFDPKHLDFHFPLFTTSMHMLVQFTLASLVLYLFPSFRPRLDSISNPNNTQTEAESAGPTVDEKKPLMTWWFYTTRLGPCGLATGLDIGLGNMSLKFISLTFYTMCKSSALAFVLLFAFLFHLETPSWRLVGIIFTMTVGVVMMVFGEVDFSALGFVLIISAAFFSGFRWALTQILLLRNPATSNPFSSIFYLAPIMCFSLLLIALPVEGLPSLFRGLQNLVSTQGALKGPCLLIFPGIIAFLMTASEFALLQRTSVVTLSIAGIFKEVVTISAAGIVFGDPLTRVNVSGLFVTIGAIAAYNYVKITKMRKEALLEVKLGDERESQDPEALDESEASNRADEGLLSNKQKDQEVFEGAPSGSLLK